MFSDRSITWPRNQQAAKKATLLRSQQINNWHHQKQTNTLLSSQRTDTQTDPTRHTTPSPHRKVLSIYSKPDARQIFTHRFRCVSFWRTSCNSIPTRTSFANQLNVIRVTLPEALRSRRDPDLRVKVADCRSSGTRRLRFVCDRPSCSLRCSRRATDVNLCHRSARAQIAAVCFTSQKNRRAREPRRESG
ncbi:hypothetical protein FB108_2907 [Brevibacterium jeotgali]|nr:hypothetical protein FB108_2907 [Brevibacterium jeotgali]